MLSLRASFGIFFPLVLSGVAEVWVSDGLVGGRIFSRIVCSKLLMLNLAMSCVSSFLSIHVMITRATRINIIPNPFRKNPCSLANGRIFLMIFCHPRAIMRSIKESPNAYTKV